MDKGKYCGTVFIDLQKAFDTVDHGCLLAKQHSYMASKKMNLING